MNVSNPSVLTYVLGAQKNHLIEMVLLITHNSPPDKRVSENFFFFISHTKHVVVTQKNCLNETVLLSTQNTCLN